MSHGRLAADPDLDQAGPRESSGACLSVLAGRARHAHLGPAAADAIFGVGRGRLVAAIALSATLTYRGSGVVNFPLAAMAMYASFIFYDLWHNGKLFFPPPLPHVRSSPTCPRRRATSCHPARAATGGLGGAAITLGDVRGARGDLPPPRVPPAPQARRRSPRSSRRSGSTSCSWSPRRSGSPRPSRFDGDPARRHVVRRIGRDPSEHRDPARARRGVAAILWAVFKFTRFGLATRAAAENERGALILGYNPNRYAGVNWIVSTVLAGDVRHPVRVGQRDGRPLTDHACSSSPRWRRRCSGGSARSRSPSSRRVAPRLVRVVAPRSRVAVVVARHGSRPRTGRSTTPAVLRDPPRPLRRRRATAHAGERARRCGCRGPRRRR